MLAETQAGVRHSLFEKIKAEVDNADISAEVVRSARAQVSAIVGETLGQSERKAGTRRKQRAEQEPDAAPEPAREVGVTVAPKAPSKNGVNHG